MTVLRETGVTTGLGLAAGLSLALAASAALRPLLYGVAPIDGATFIGVPFLLALVSAAAALGARRAARIDPLIALRTDA